jgi:DNA polymerase
MSLFSAHFDFETRSAVDLAKAGVHRYAEHESTGVWCLSYLIGKPDPLAPIKRWWPGAPDPTDLLDWIADGGRTVAHNVQFDRNIWNRCVRRVYAPHWPEIKIEQTDCTMARALAMGLPAGLDMLGAAIGAKVTKDKDGHRLMMQMCRPRSINPDGSIVWWTDPAKVERLMEYCDTDIRAEAEVDLMLPQLSASERAIWLLDQTINERGVMVDAVSCEAAERAVEYARKRANERIWYVTGGDVKKTSEVAKILAWLNKRGIPAESLQKGDMEELVLKADVIGDPDAEAVVRLRRAAAKTSNDKYVAMTRSAGPDSRVRGTLAYHAAATGRWAGRLFQPQNLPRLDHEKDGADVEFIVRMLERNETPDEIVEALDVLTGDPLGTLSKCLRAMLTAGPNHKFVGGDFSNIEGRLNAWFAGEEWKLDAFRAFDNKTGPDLYNLAFARSFGVPIHAVKKSDRQVGKVMELALGYQGGKHAFQKMGANYGVHVTDERADELKAAWRGANPKITQSWWDLQDAAIEAVGSPGSKVALLDGKVTYLAANGFLFCRLPSSRVIAYAQPRLTKVEMTRTILDEDGDAVEVPAGFKFRVDYNGLDSVTNRWSTQTLYGGKQCNNVVQGAARDLMAEAMLRAERDGYPVVLTVHDELLCEVPCEPPLGLRDEDILASIMGTVPSWATGLPLAAAAWEDKRYVK